MTTTLIHPDTVEELATNSLPLPRLGVGENPGKGQSQPQRLRSEPTASAVAQPSSDSGSSQSSALPRHPTTSFNPRSQGPIPLALLDRVITLYSTHANSLNDLCRELNISMLELLDLLEHPDLTRALERLARANESRAKLLARITSDSAVSALIDLMDTTDKPETRRKSAGAILRHGKPPSKSATHQARDRATDSDAASPEKSAPPHCEAIRGASNGCPSPLDRARSASDAWSSTPRPGGASGTSPPLPRNQAA